jgi:hypothetical protein
MSQRVKISAKKRNSIIQQINKKTKIKETKEIPKQR